MKPNELSRTAYDPAMLEAFYREHVEAVERFVARRVDDPYLAADLTADVFLAAIDAAGGYRPERGVPAAWLFGVARNVIAAEHRRAERERRANARVEGHSVCARSLGNRAPRRGAIWDRRDERFYTDTTVIAVKHSDAPRLSQLGEPVRCKAAATGSRDHQLEAAMTEFRLKG